MNAPAASPFIFNWDEPRRRNFVFAGFLGVSFAIHIAGFYLFQVVYPPTASLLPAPQRVSLMTAHSEQTATLLRWIDAEDPALVSTTRRPPHMQRHEMGKVEHIPSYFAVEPALKEPPPLSVDLRIPSAQPPGPVPETRRPMLAATGPQPTQMSFSSELQQLGQPKLVPAHFKASGPEPPQNAQFRIAVDAQGAVRYCFILHSSGQAALDEQARQNLTLCHFSVRSTSNSDSLVWGIVTIDWGNDVTEAGAKPNSTMP